MLNSFKTYLLKSIKSKKLNVFALFLVLSFLFLIITKLSRLYTETITFDVAFINVPQRKVLTENKTAKVDLVVSSYGFNILPFLFQDNTIEIDFDKDLYMKKGTYIWASNKNLPNIKSQIRNKVDILAVKPDTIKFGFETLSVKKVPIKLQSAITFVAGYDVTKKISISPDSINVIGPEKEIENISEILSKPILLKNVKSNISQSISLQLPKEIHHIKLSETEVSITGNVEKFTEGTLEIPINIVNLPEHTTINYFPKTVTVIYYVSLNEFKHIKVLDFIVECDYNDALHGNTTVLTPRLIKKPNLVKSARIKQNKVEFILMQ
ncbi:CdaR family protein [Lacinutrix undariae]